MSGLVWHGRLLLNHNLDRIDHGNRIVYLDVALPLGSQGTATLFLGHVRISTNVRLFGERRATGRRLSRAVRDGTGARPDVAGSGVGGQRRVR